MQPGSSGRDVDIRRQEVVGVTDDAKWKSSCTTRASPALAHGADEGYNVVKEQTDVGVTPANENDSLPAAASTTVADDQQSVKNSYHSVRSLKHKNDWSYKYGTGSADLHRASSLQDLTERGGSAVERSDSPLTANTVSCSDNASDVHSLHCALSSPSDACLTNSACTRYDRSSTAHAGEQSSPARRSRCRMRQQAADPELELVSSTGIVSNTAQFWEDLMVDSSCSAARCSMHPRHVSEDRHRFVRRGASFPRYSTIGAPCDIQALHGMIFIPRTAPDVLSGLESVHVNSDLEVCFLFLSYNLYRPICNSL